MSALRERLREVVALRSAPGSWVAAVQAAVAVTAIPTIFAASGRLQIGLLASFGALIVLYESDRSRRERATRLPVFGSAFLAGAAVGIATAESALANLLAICAIAVVFSFLSLGFNVGPPGAIFPVLVTGAAAQLTAPRSADGMGLDPLTFVGMVSLGIAAGYSVVVVPLIVPSVRARDAERTTNHSWKFDFPRDNQRIFARLVAAVLAATLISNTLGLHHISWVLLAAIGILQKDSDVHLGTVRMTQRLGGTVLGIGLALLFGIWVPAGFALLAIVAVLIFGFVSLLRRNLMLALMLVTPMALLLVAGGSAHNLLVFTGIRIADTLAGAAVAAVILTVAGVTAKVKTRPALRRSALCTRGEKAPDRQTPAANSGD